MAFCANCGTSIPDNAAFCPNCGQAAASPFGAAPRAPQPPQYAQPVQYPPRDGAQPLYYPPAPPPPPPGPRVFDIYSRVFDVLFEKPVLLWGLSLLCTLLMGLASILGVLPIVSLPIIFCLQAGMTAVYLDGYRRRSVNSDQIFFGFKNFWHVAGGMGWMYLWVLIWSLIPVAGIVFGVIKLYSYRFVPYILIQEPDVSATEALRESMRRTQGYRGRMFGADILIIVAVYVVLLIFLLLSRIPAVGILFAVLGGIIYILVFLALPLVMGLLNAAFYDEIEKLEKE